MTEKLGKAIEDFTAAGLELHETSTGTGEREALGTSLDCSRFKSRVTTRRFWNLRMAISAFLRRRRATGKALEVLIGHATFAGLANRWVLSVFHLVYKFCRQHYVVAAPLWDGVRAELYAFRGLMIYLEADWWVPVHPAVYATDSSEAGLAFTESQWRLTDPTDVSCRRYRAELAVYALCMMAA